MTQANQDQLTLLRAEKFKILEGLIRGFGHELNNPLTAIMGYAQLLETTVEDEESLDFISHIGEQAERCRKIIDSLLDFAPKTKGARKPVFLNQVIQDLLKLKKSQLQKHGIHIELRLAEDLPKVYLNLQHFQYALLKILMNFQEELDEKEPRTRRIRIRSLGGKKTVRLQFTDNCGWNLQKGDCPRETACNEKTGIHRDLEFCRQMIEEHGGWMKVLTRKNRGTKIKLELPTEYQEGELEEGRIESDQPSNQSVPDGSARILVVDDEMPVRSLLEKILKYYQFEVFTAASGEEAMDFLAKEEVDLIIADLNMPGMGGGMLYQKLTNLKPHLQRRIIFTTGDSVSDDNKAYLVEAERPFLPKPFNVVDVKKMVDKILKEELDTE